MLTEARVNHARQGRHIECSCYLRYFQFTLSLSECNPIVYQDATQVAQMVKNLSAMQEMQKTWVLPGSGRYPGGGHCLTLVFLLESPMDRGAWRATVRRSQRVGHD